MSAQSNTCLIVKMTTTTPTTTTVTATNITTTATITATQTTRVVGVVETDNTTMTTTATHTENMTDTTVTATNTTTTNISSSNSDVSSQTTVLAKASNVSNALILNLNRTINNESVLLTTTAKPADNSSTLQQETTDGRVEQIVPTTSNTDIKASDVSTTTGSTVLPAIVNNDKEISEGIKDAASKIIVNFDDDQLTDEGVKGTKSAKEEKVEKEDGTFTIVKDDATEEKENDGASFKEEGDDNDDSDKEDDVTSKKDEQIQRDFVPAHRKTTPVAALPATNIANNAQEKGVQEGGDDEDDDEGSTFIDPQSEVYTILKNNNNKKPHQNIGDGVAAAKRKFLEVLGEADEDDVNAALHHGKSLFTGESLLPGETPSSNKKEIENALLLTGETLSGESSSPSAAAKTGDANLLNKTSSENLISKQLTVDPDIQPKKRSRRGLKAVVAQYEDIFSNTPQKMNSPTTIVTAPIACVVILIAGIVVIVGIVMVKRRRRDSIVGSLVE